MQIRDIEARGMTFTVREHGSGDPVILLHGFPETSKMWERIMPGIADAGYHCIAPNMRGYSPGARPSEVEAYRYEELGADIHALAQAFGAERFHLVGHDWGAGAGWCALHVDAAPIVSWTAMSVPHYAGFAPAVWDDPEEEAYRNFLEMFVDPNTAAGMSADDAAGIKLAWTDASPDEIDDYVSVFKELDAMQAALNYYVAADRHKRYFENPSFFGPVSTPTLMLWGKNDMYIRPRALKLAKEHMTGPYRVVELDAGHWLIQEQTEQVRDEILTHLKENPL